METDKLKCREMGKAYYGNTIERKSRVITLASLEVILKMKEGIIILTVFA